MSLTAERLFLVHLLTENATLEPNGKPVEIIYAGEFELRDRGRVLELTEENIDSMVDAFNKFNESGRIPFNVNHSGGSTTLEAGRAVGYLTGLFTKRDEETGRYSLYGAPHWLQDTKEALAEMHFRFLSAEIVFGDSHPVTKEEIPFHLVGCAICTSPAIPDLEPISLTARNDMALKKEITIASFAKSLEILKINGSILEHAQNVAEAFFKTFMDTNNESYWPKDCFEEFIIVEVQSENSTNLYRVDYTVTDEAITFADRENWQAVEQQYVPLNRQTAPEDGGSGVEPSAMNNTTAHITMSTTNQAAESGKKERSIMDEKLRELLGLDAEASVEDAVAALLATVEEVRGQNEALMIEKAEAEQKVVDAETEAAKVEEAETTLTETRGQIETLTVELQETKGEAETLATRVAELEAETLSREAEDRVELALRQGRITPAQLDDQEGWLRGLALTSPTEFDKYMNILPANEDQFIEVGKDGEEKPPVSEDALFEATDARMKETGEDWPTAHKAVLAANPKFTKVITG